jgi:hypothetical protein
MTKRIASALVVFQRPFILDGFDDVQPAGSYSIETEEEKLDGSSESPEVWRRLSTSIRLVRHGAAEYIPVDPRALAAALERDNAQSDNLSPQKTAESRRSVARKLNGFSARLWK